MTITRPAVTSELQTLLSLIAAELQLPISLHAKAQDRYRVVTGLLQQSPLGRHSIEVYSQGSYRIGTTVKPLLEEEFDLDFVMELTALDERTDPGNLVDAVWEVFKASPHHSAMVERHTSCIRLVYADEFHMDIVPAVPYRGRGDTAILIPRMNGDEVQWHGTDPKGYASWFLNVSAWTVRAKEMKVEPLPRPLPASEKTSIQTCVQLYKRNHQVNVEDEDLRTASIVLTTITADSAKDATTLGDGFNSLVDSLPSFVGHPTPPVILNPAAPYETISEKWITEPRRYDAFEEHTARLRQDWHELLLLQGRDHAALVKKLADMFDDRPVERAVKALSEQRQAARVAGALATGAGGVLQVDPARRGNPIHTYYGGG